MSPDPEFVKKVDEAWKEQAEKERKSAVARGPGPPSQPAARSREVPQADFSFFLSTLSMQALMALGEVPHPQTGARQADLGQARTLIDILGTLQEKTKGNLTPEEADLLEGLLYELRMKYVEKAKPEGGRK